MATLTAGAATAQVRAARDFLLNHREDYATAYRDFRWPELDEFNWALDWFDVIARGAATGRRCGSSSRTARETALHLRRAVGALQPGRQLAARAGRRAAATGSSLMLGNQVELWETMLAAMKLGAVVIPATPLLGPADLRDRVDARRGAVTSSRRRATRAKFDDVPGDYTRIAVGEPVDGWLRYARRRRR